MANYRKILVAFDGSESSKNALREAITLAELEKSWIKVLAVVPTYEGDLELVGVSDLEKVLRGPREKLIKAAEEVAMAQDTKVLTNVEQGEAYEKIVDVADEERCDLIVMGRSGIHHIEKILMGSVTARVIGYSTKDVIVVPRNATLNLNHILLATDGSAHSDAALERALHFATRYKGKLSAVSVVDVYPEFYAEAPSVVENMEKRAISIIDGVKKKARSAGVDIETTILRGNAAEEIAIFANNNNVSSVFMGTRGWSGIKKLLMGSVTEKLIGLTDQMVLVAKG